jgi:hypothetical protein
MLWWKPINANNPTMRHIRAVHQNIQPTSIKKVQTQFKAKGKKLGESGD